MLCICGDANSGGVTTATVTMLNYTIYSEETLKNMTVAEIKAIAAERGYTITKTIKADIIAEFLQQQ